jgi:hypothetical protein
MILDPEVPALRETLGGHRQCRNKLFNSLECSTKDPQLAVVWHLERHKEERCVPVDPPDLLPIVAAPRRSLDQTIERETPVAATPTNILIPRQIRRRHAREAILKVDARMIERQATGQRSLLCKEPLDSCVSGPGHKSCTTPIEPVPANSNTITVPLKKSAAETVL